VLTGITQTIMITFFWNYTIAKTKTEGGKNKELSMSVPDS